MKKRLLIAGGSGLIGSALATEAKKQQWDVTILSRQQGEGRIMWDPEQKHIDLERPQVYDAIINLAGASIAGAKWTEQRKKEIYDSRIHASQTLEKYLQDKILTTSFYLGISGVGIYGDTGNEVVNENTTISLTEDWFIKTTRDWEAGHQRISSLGIRTIIMRTGIVLSKEGGALKEIINTPGFPVLSFFGNGQQIWSWIHIKDLVRMILFFMEYQLEGIYNASSPNPVANKIFTQTINHYLSPHRMVTGVPKFMMSMILGESSRVLFESCHASSEKIQQAGFLFNFSDLDVALKDLLQ